jgi:tetratricopeptide (TPR) repeat protein
MAKSKKQKEQFKKPVINTDFIFEPSNPVKYIIYLSAGLLSLIFAVIYIFSANSVNGGFGFPLDDPWIHLTFAKNLVDYHSFSYFRTEMATAGSTSPVYTLILAAGFFISRNEMILSYVLGISFLILSSIFFYKLTSFDFARENYYAIIATAILIADKWMNFVSVSGMETTLFIFILLATAYFYRQRNAVLFAVFFSLIMWARPDGIAFIGALAVDYFIVTRLSKSDRELRLFTKNDFIRIGITITIFLVLYFAMNLVLSGSLLPNTYNAKLTYYSPEFRSRAEFFKNEVWNYFIAGAYGIAMIGFLAGSVFALLGLLKKKYTPYLLYIMFVAALVFIYWYKLPYAHRFGRYMMPVIPFFILVSSMGFRDLFKIAASYMNSAKIASGGIIITLLIILSYSLFNYADNKSNYAAECKYISDRQVAAAIWIKNNTNENDIIATHDVGAIGYYSDRKIVDVAGLVTPGLIDKISDLNYVSYMKEVLDKSGVTYLAFLREWYRVANQKSLFTTESISPVEIMEVFKYTPGKTLILSKSSNGIILNAINAFGTRNPQQIQRAMQYLNSALQYDPNSSTTYFLLGVGSMLNKDNANAEKYLLKAVEIFPDYKDALGQLGLFYRQSGKPVEAIKYFEKYLVLNPDDKNISGQLKELIEQEKKSGNENNKK